jgi:anti-sigma-K factor RskA
MNIPDDMLMAYADGELSAEDRARVEAEMSSDPGVARRVAQHQALHGNLRAAFDGVLKEPVPDRLLAAARGSSGVVDIAAAARARGAKQEARVTRRWSWPEWGAIAASLLLGVILTRVSLRSQEAAPFTSQQGQLVAHAGLADALSNQLAVSQSHEATTQVGLSFRATSGSYCRTFTLREGEAFAGLACREGNEWRIDVLARTDAASGDYAQAGSALPAAVLSAVEQQIDGEPLDAASEARARQTGWRGAGGR